MDGGWFERPRLGIVYTDWQARRPGGTLLLYADAAWRDRTGAKVPPPLLLASASIAPSVVEDGGADAGNATRSVRPPDVAPTPDVAPKPGGGASDDAAGLAVGADGGAR
jgi:hypothetical protein